MPHLMQNGTGLRRRVGYAIAAAGLLLSLGRFGYAYLEGRYARGIQSVPIPPDSLSSRIPMKLSDWEGRDDPMSEALIRATDTDAHLSRRYRQLGSSEEVSVWVGYGGRLRDLVPHRPEVCYPGNGYTLQSQRRLDLPTADGTNLSCRVLHFARGSLETQQIVVLNYYIVDGISCPDVSMLREAAARFESGTGRYVAQVQIVCTYRAGRNEPDSPVREFARVAAPEISRAIQEAVRSGAHAPAGANL